MLVKQANKTYLFVTKLDFVSDYDYYRYLLQQKYKTCFAHHVSTKQRIVRYIT